jgi:hypothetical protein
MPKPMRYEGAKMNFDPMTDTITNVAGAMIRLVILVLLITQPKLIAPGGGVDIGPEDKGTPSDDNTGRPLRPLLAEIETLKSLIRDVERETALLERELPALRHRVEKLRQAAAPKPGARQSRQHAPRFEPATPAGTRWAAFTPQAWSEGAP